VTDISMTDSDMTDSDMTDSDVPSLNCLVYNPALGSDKFAKHRYTSIPADRPNRL
jgi:hypothetical protein